MNAEESEKVSRFILRANGTMNPKIVGKSAQAIADMAGIKIPAFPSSIVENNISTYAPTSNSTYMMMDNAVAEGSAATRLQAGMLSVTANVTIRYEID